MYVIRQQRGKETTWLISRRPERWGEQDQAMRFETRGDARRVALEIGLSGDWSINAGTPAQAATKTPSRLATAGPRQSK